MLKTILLPLDGSHLAERALPYATTLARHAGGRIVLVQAVQANSLPGVDPSNAQVEVTSRADTGLADIVGRLRAEGIEAEAHVYYDEPTPAILDAAERHNADLIVMSTHGRSGLGRMMYGSVADSVLRHAETPVLLIPPLVDHSWPSDQPLTALVPLDGSELAEAALAATGLLTKTTGARLHLLRVIEPPTYPLYGDGYAYIPFDEDAEMGQAGEYLQSEARALEADGTRVSTQVTLGQPGTVIPAIARDARADVVVMATHGRGGLARLVMGSVALGAIQRANVPVLLTRPTSLEQEVPGSPAAATPGSSVTLTLTPSDLKLVEQALEALAENRDETCLAAPARALLDRVRAAEGTNERDLAGSAR
ncbi:MAG: universal stress protein [Chloroflexi bacterium]|nr:universal stress protein [Chloroflexota bacterium]